jgi:two-component system chemotaxis response regulator CheB
LAMAHRDMHLDGALRGVVAMGASAGGVEALTRLAAGLPEDLPYAVLVALHMPSNAPSVLASIIDRSGPLPAVAAADGAALEAGTIHVAVPDRHLLVRDHRVMLSEGPTENGYRPSINALFRSIAVDFGPRSIGLLLSGVLDDGVLGLAAIKNRGGIAVVQAPEDALFPAMPRNALEAGVSDHQAAAADVGTLLTKLADEETKKRQTERDTGIELENKIAMAPRFSTSFSGESLGPHSGYICPDCNGTLMTVSEDNYRCRVGHAWTGEALLRARDAEVEGALWVALRSLQEKAVLSRKMAKTAGSGMLGRRYSATAEEAERAVSVLARQLSEGTSDTGERGGG